MSFKVVDWIMEQYVPDHACGRLLMVLGTFADDTGKCFPRVRHLAKRASMSIRTTHRTLKKLFDDHPNLIEHDRQNGSASVYKIKCPNFRDLSLSSSANMLAEPSAKQSTARTRTRTRKPLSSNLAEVGMPPVGRTENLQSNHHPNNNLPDAGPRARAVQGQEGSKIEHASVVQSRIANRLGTRGWDILAALSASELDQLTAQERCHRLGARALADLRLRFPAPYPAPRARLEP